MMLGKINFIKTIIKLEKKSFASISFAINIDVGTLKA